MAEMKQLSVVVPLLNEEGNLEPLHGRLAETLGQLGTSYEIVFVDDGSTDDSVSVLTRLLEADGEHVRVVELRRNFGKTAALVAGFEYAKGEMIVTMDADLQDDPGEIPAMMAKLQEGHDVVMGWRVDRRDRATKKLSSRLFNFLVRKSTGTSYRDLNCGFKAYRREVLQSVRLYSDMHRFIPILAAAEGFRVVEMPVKHHPRHSGRSKFGTGRAARGFIDLLTVLYLTTFGRNPLRLFGWIGLTTFAFGAAVSLYLAFLWVLRFLGAADVAPIGNRPLFFAGLIGMILGFQLISIGLIGEMIRYYTYRPSAEYSVRRVRP